MYYSWIRGSACTFEKQKILTECIGNYKIIQRFQGSYFHSLIKFDIPLFREVYLVVAALCHSLYDC